jgi:hypothetical protein
MKRALLLPLGLFVTACGKPDFVVLKNDDGSVAGVVRRDAVQYVVHYGPNVKVVTTALQEGPGGVSVRTSMENLASQLQ